MATMEVSTKLEPWHFLPGKVVMITGASSGLGRELCLDLARVGCRIIAAARRVDRLQSLCEEINHVKFPISSSSTSADAAEVGDPRAVAVELDVNADGPTVETSVQKAWESFGFIDALINNAGFRGGVDSSLELREGEWDRVLGTNLKGSWLVSKCVCRHMSNANRGGSVINISSALGLNRVQVRGSAAYSSSKTGLNALTQVMAIELGHYKIRVNSISPGIFKSEITEWLMRKSSIKNYVAKVIPLRAIVTSDPALTSLVRYLIHDSSEYISGNNFIVDAGLTLPGIPIYSSI